MNHVAIPTVPQTIAAFDLPGFDGHVARSPNAITAEIDGQLVALDMDSGTCFGLNRVATRIWQMIAAPRTPRAITLSLLEMYDVPPETCADEVNAVMQELVEIGLATRA